MKFRLLRECDVEFSRCQRQEFQHVSCWLVLKIWNHMEDGEVMSQGSKRQVVVLLGWTLSVVGTLWPMTARGADWYEPGVQETAFSEITEPLVADGPADSHELLIGKVGELASELERDFDLELIGEKISYRPGSSKHHKRRPAAQNGSRRRRTHRRDAHGQRRHAGKPALMHRLARLERKLDRILDELDARGPDDGRGHRPGRTGFHHGRRSDRRLDNCLRCRGGRAMHKSSRRFHRRPHRDRFVDQRERSPREPLKRRHPRRHRERPAGPGRHHRGAAERDDSPEICPADAQIRKDVYYDEVKQETSDRDFDV